MSTCWTIRQKWRSLVVSTVQFSSDRSMAQRSLKIVPIAKLPRHRNCSKQRDAMIAPLVCIVQLGQRCPNAQESVFLRGVDHIVSLTIIL